MDCVQTLRRKDGRQLRRKEVEEVIRIPLWGNGRWTVGWTGTGDRGGVGLPTYHFAKISSVDIDGGRKYTLGLRT